MENFFKIFIIAHASSGFISLIAGTISVIASKGNHWHRKSGKIFYYGMLIAGASGLVAAILPGHLNPFLFVIALFTLYLTLTGYRALGFKRVKKRSQIKRDIFYAYTMLALGLGMVVFGIYSVYVNNVMGWVLTVFGSVGIINALLDLRAFSNLKMLRRKSLRLHIGKITGAYIASFTAFFVTNEVLPSVLSWLLPTAFGIIFITYWLRKTRIKGKKTTQTA